MIVRQDWDATRRWLIKSLDEMSVDDVIDIGDREAVEDQEVVDCCDVTKLDDGFVVRLSRIALVDLVVVEDGLTPDHWDYGDDLATDGRLFSEDVELVAAIAIGWFRDRLGVVGPEALGFTFCGA